MKQTSVEWLFENLIVLNADFQYSVISYETYIMKRIELLEKAKEIDRNNICDFAEFVAKYPDKNINKNGEMLHAKSKYDGAERTIDLLEIYYAEKR